MCQECVSKPWQNGLRRGDKIVAQTEKMSMLRNCGVLGMDREQENNCREKAYHTISFAGGIKRTKIPPLQLASIYDHQPSLSTVGAKETVLGVGDGGAL